MDPLKKILIAEDEKDLRMMLAEDVKAAGYNVYEAPDGNAALEKAEQIKPDLIITDVLMPGINGNELIKKLRLTQWGRKTPFIILTARHLMRDYFDIMGVDEFVDKPFSTKDILAKIDKIFKKQMPAAANSVEASADALPKQAVSPPPSSPKPSSDESSGDKKKYCHNCERTIPYDSSLCPRCGSTKISDKL